MTHPTTAPTSDQAGTLTGFQQTFQYIGRAAHLVWQTSPRLFVLFATLTIAAGIIPAGIAYMGQLIVDAVIAASQATIKTDGISKVCHLVIYEALLVIALAACQRGISACQSLLRALIGQKVNVMILEKALTLNLSQFEDADLYDKLTRARREASSRPLSLINRSFGLVQNGISLVSFGLLLVNFSGWAVVILAVAGLPGFFAETKFSGDAFRLFRWRSPDTRMQLYLETVMAREDHAKEVQLYQLGPMLLGRYTDIFRKIFAEDRKLSIKRDFWGFLLGLISSGSFYAAYIWIALATIAGTLSLGEMTMYLMLFRQGQTAVAAILSAISGLYEDNLYLSNLYEFLEVPVTAALGTATTPIDVADGIRFEGVSFSYPGSEALALRDISFHVPRGQALALVGENGAGKTTLIKLLTRLYLPRTGRILLDGRDIRDWELAALHQRIGVIFQDFNRYQILAGENIGVGDVQAFSAEDRWQQAAEKAYAAEFLARLPNGYHTQLGRWFNDGRELSGGQWQKIALARAFMREAADVLILDEPTAAMDAAAEADVFAHFQSLMTDKIAILISHRFSTVRLANRILVLQNGQISEQGSHEQLMAQNGRYAELFNLQAQGYK